MLRYKGDVLAIQSDIALIHEKSATDGIERRGFSGAIGADDGDKISILHRKAQVIQRHLLIDRSLVEGLTYINHF